MACLHAAVTAPKSMNHSCWCIKHNLFDVAAVAVTNRLAPCNSSQKQKTIGRFGPWTLGWTWPGSHPSDLWQVGMGPCGELRYPSYMMSRAPRGWRWVRRSTLRRLHKGLGRTRRGRQGPMVGTGRELASSCAGRSASSGTGWPDQIHWWFMLVLHMSVIVCSCFVYFCTYSDIFLVIIPYFWAYIYRVYWFSCYISLDLYWIARKSTLI